MGTALGLFDTGEHLYRQLIVTRVTRRVKLRHKLQPRSMTRMTRLVVPIRPTLRPMPLR